MVLVVLIITMASSLMAEKPIKLNQLGFYPDAEKIAIVPDEAAGEFHVRDVKTDQIVFSSELQEPKRWQHSLENVAIADFTGFTQTGNYRLEHEGTGYSHEFQINRWVHRKLSKAAIKALYFNRASTALDEEYAGQWARTMGHPDDEVIIHESAATAARPEGYTFASPKGWYDAGDFNKYIVNSGISTFTLLAAYEHFPDYYENLQLNIPESGNNQPDLLDEARWNLDWMLTMQDPNDGGVYHKLTAPNFEGRIMPHQANSDRYVVMKTTAATLNFAAVMAVASRVYKNYDQDFADEALDAAKDAWQWAQQNPEVYYDQAEMNQEFNPNIHTGEYGDTNVEDEFDWAAAELYITTKDDDFWESRNFEEAETGIPVWQYVRPLAWVSLGHHLHDLTDAADINLIIDRLLEQADLLLEEYESSAYRISMGKRGGMDFVWGSNGTAANHSLMLLQIYNLAGLEKYLQAALSNLDYLLGRNATGYSFVTGYGSHTPMDPHHRQSAADNNPEPVPGFLVGGPQAGQQDGCNYPSDFPAKSYLDDWCSYSTNEVAINWNAPLIYITGALEHYLGDEPVNSPLVEKSYDFELDQNYPNPFNPVTEIKFTLSEPTEIKLEVFTVSGEKIAIPAQGYYREGSHTVQFDASGLSSGVYIYRLQSGLHSRVRKMTFLK